MNKVINTIHFDITLFCNYHCEYCFQGMEKQQTHISDTVYENFFKFLERQKETFAVHLIGGEPFLYPRFFEMVQRIIDTGHKVSITTNFSLTEKSLRKFLNIAKGKIFFWEISVHLTQIKDMDEFYKKLNWFKEQSGLDYSDFQIDIVLLEEIFEDIVQTKNKIEKLGFRVHIQRKTIWQSYQEYPQKIEDWLKTENIIDVPLEWVRNKEAFDVKSKVCRCGNKFFKILIDGKIKRCFTPQIDGWDELGDLEKSSNARTLSDYAPCFTTNNQCSCYRNFKRGRFVFDKEDVPLNRQDIKYDVAISGFGFSDNFGAILTNYALMMYIKSIGLNPLMIEKPADLFNYNFSEKHYYCGIARRFINKYLYNNISRIYKNKYDFMRLNNICSTFITGSDQVWSNTLYKPAQYFTFLDFVAPEHKKIAYSCSLGYNDWAVSPFYNDYERLEMKYALRKFDHVSVREDSAKKTLKEQFDISAAHVLDSVFIGPRKYYDELIENSSAEIKKDYMLAYLLNPDAKLKNAASHTKNKLNLDIMSITDPGREDSAAILEYSIDAEVEDFLKYVKNSSFVLTNSFHGVCFAIIFKKPFIHITDPYRKDWNTRIKSLLKMLNLENRTISCMDEIYTYPYFNSEINYEKVFEILERQKEFSMQWLRNALDTPKTKPKYNEAESMAILHEKTDYLHKQIDEMNSNLRKKVDNIHKQINEINSGKILEAMILLLQYCKYKVLSKITFGKKRRDYKEKRNMLYEKIRGIRNYAWQLY